MVISSVFSHLLVTVKSIKYFCGLGQSSEYSASTLGFSLDCIYNKLDNYFGWNFVETVPVLEKVPVKTRLPIIEKRTEVGALLVRPRRRSAPPASARLEQSVFKF